MKGNGWMQRMLYLLIVMLGIYIVYRGGRLFMEQPAVQTVLDEGVLQRRLENAAARTWTGGYAAALEGRKRNWFGSWFRAVLPVYSYLIENGEGESETEYTDQNNEKSEATVNAADADHILPDEKEETDGRNKKEGGGTETEILKNDAVGTEEDAHREVQTEKEENKKSRDAEELDEKIKNDENITADTEAEASADTERPADFETEGSETEDSTEEQKETGTDLSTDAPLESEPIREVLGHMVSQELLSELSDFNYLVNEYFTVDGGTTADAALLNAEDLLSEDLSIVKNPEIPQILIYHTHSQEAFADSVPENVETTIVGMGDVLANALEKKGYQVIHDTGTYDLVNGVLDRSAAYDYARTAIEGLLDQYPTIQVVIDLHRDGVDGQKFVTEIDGKPCSMVMFFNGISRNQQGEISYLPNPYVKQNLAFSFQMELAARQQYPGFTRNIYLKAERFNLHLRPRSVLIEAGTQLNTVEEEQNAMEVLANLLDEVLRPS